ncbi:MAG: RsmB/NOP family class I SAM-dependent RNA methyltransferase [Lachnospiraceae bacterium]|nr:RsmB/NOP family class I SAM-dependent RNA methyltransferase [Lachnospiraceae bacterium]
MSLPERFVENMKALLGDGFEAYEESFNMERLYGLRTNRLKTDAKEFADASEFNLRQIPWIDNGFYYDGNIRPAKHPYYYAGVYYLQEPSAMTPANRLEIKPGDKVLDICAAPGGKSTELGAKLMGDGLLFTNDISNSRAQALLKNIELFGIGNVVVTSEAPYKLAAKLPEYFDKILIDAPCSGEGMFRKDVAVMRAWTEKSNDTFSALQREILDYAVQMLKPGGMLMYSTCTFSPRENEESVSYLLDNHPEFSLVDIAPYEGFKSGMTDKGNLSPDLAKCVRIWPQHMDGEGHFLALFKKAEGEVSTHFLPYRMEVNRRELEKQSELFEFLGHISKTFDKNRIDIRQGSKVYYLPEELPDLTGIRIMRTGLLLGEVKKNRFEPSQALAMTLKADEFDNVVDLKLNDDNVIKYLKGETIDVDCAGLKDGFALVCVDGYPLGWGKLNGSTLKNKYLQGWRWQ